MRMRPFSISPFFFSLIPLLAVSCKNPAPGVIQLEPLKTYRTAFTNGLVIEEVPEQAAVVRAWLPLPPANGFQEINHLKIDPPVGSIRREEIYGNQILYIEWRKPAEKKLEVKVSYDLLRREEVAHSEETPPRLMERYLQPDRLGIIDKRIQKLAAEITAGQSGVMAKAWAIYRHVLEHMEYDKDAPGWGRGDAARACKVGKGNCSDYHALFISLARASGIPARFHYGLSLKPDGSTGPHCWAEFFDLERGWVPVDISEADKDPPRIRYFFGRLSEDRVLYSTGRDLVLNPPQAGEPLNFFIAPYVEVDSQPYAKVTFTARHSPQS